MTVQELYQSIGGDYDQAMRILRMDKLLDKHIRKFTKNNLVENLLAAGESMDPTALFEAAHALKGVSANLGLTALSNAASEITEEFRPGASRRLSDDEVKAKLRALGELYRTVAVVIRRYEVA